jgi:hypothetical protein
MQREREDKQAAALGDEIHLDLWGPAPVETINHKEYFVSFTDDCKRYTVIYLMAKKSETFENYLAFETWLKTQHNIQIKMLRSNRGGEYLSGEFSAHLKKVGTARRLTVHDTLEYNGVSERLNRTLLEKVRAMLHESHLPRFLWGEALMHAVYVKNRTWTQSLNNTTPFELLTGAKPDMSNMHVWGSRVWVHDTNGTKLDGRVKEGRWVGFDEESKGHRIYWVEKRSVTVERSVKWLPEEVGIGGVPLEGELEDFDEPEQPEASDNPIPIKNDMARPLSPIPEAIVNQVIDNVPPQLAQPVVAADVDSGRGKRIRKESAYIWRI